jgi:large subunit ribosomal protein L6e
MWMVFLFCFSHRVGKKTSTAKPKEETPAFVEKTVGGKANGEKRLVPTNKASKYYPVRSQPSPTLSL